MQRLYLDEDRSVGKQRTRWEDTVERIDYRSREYKFGGEKMGIEKNCGAF
jgi:hypothetical protein